jgi:hypothetical protein
MRLSLVRTTRIKLQCDANPVDTVGVLMLMGQRVFRTVNSDDLVDADNTGNLHY